MNLAPTIPIVVSNLGLLFLLWHPITFFCKSFFRLEAITGQVRVAKKETLLKRLLAYWTLKRQSRNGVPLLRRLQSNHMSRPTDQVLLRFSLPSYGAHSLIIRWLWSYHPFVVINSLYSVPMAMWILLFEFSPL